MSPRVLVAGVGNLFLSDDGFGPEVVRRLDLPGSQPLPPGVRVVDYGIRGMHLVYDLLDGWDALVLVDAMPSTEALPGEVRLVRVTEGDLGEGELDAHGMDPVAVLSGLGALGGTLPPTYVIGCHPATVAEGIGLSGPVMAAVDGAVDLLRRLVADLSVPGAARPTLSRPTAQPSPIGGR